MKAFRNIAANHVIFPSVAEAEAALAGLFEAADAGETFAVIPNPIEGKASAIIARYFNGAFEGYF